MDGILSWHPRHLCSFIKLQILKIWVITPLHYPEILHTPTYRNILWPSHSSVMLKQKPKLTIENELWVHRGLVLGCQKLFTTYQITWQPYIISCIVQHFKWTCSKFRELYNKRCIVEHNFLVKKSGKVGKKLTSPRRCKIQHWDQNPMGACPIPHNCLNFVFPICSLFGRKSNLKKLRKMELYNKTCKVVKYIEGL